MKSSQKWLIALGTTLSMGTAALAVHAATDQETTPGERMQSGMHRDEGQGMGNKMGRHGAQSGHGHGMSSENKEGQERGHGRGMHGAMSGEHQHTADASGTEGHTEGGRHGHMQNHEKGEGMGEGGQHR
jgi:hypothetical protein